MKGSWFSKEVLGWSLYDWANSAFATSVMGVFFPIFFRKYWNGEGVASGEITFRLGVVSSAASLVIVVLAPMLGSIADRLSARKKFLFLFASIGVTMTAVLPLIAQGQWFPAALLYLLASIGFMGGNSFYDALLVEVTTEEHYDVVSGFGFGIGYLGGGLLLIGHAVFLNKFAAFGVPDVSTAVKLSIASVAVWWALFSLPIFLLVKEKDRGRASDGASAITAGFKDLIQTFREIKRLKHTALFLLAYWLYIDGVDTVVRMAADYGMAIEGIKEADLITAFVITQLVGFPAAIAYGWIAKKTGARIGIYVAIVAYIGICCYGYFVDTKTDFFVVAVCVGLVQGGIQSVSRAVFARLVPPSRTAQFFGFYNMVGKFAAVLGPLLMGVVALFVDRQTSILSLIILFVAGGFVYLFVDEEKGRADALAYDDANSRSGGDSSS